MFCQLQNRSNLALLPVIQIVEQHADIVGIEATAQMRRLSYEARATSIEQHEAIERDEGATTANGGDLVRSDADPRDATINPVRNRLSAKPADANHRIELPRANAAHAVVDAEPAIAIRIAGMGSLVDQRSHITVFAEKLVAA